MPFTVLNTVPLIPVALSLPAHLLLICVLFRYRKTSVFNTAYFKILLSLTIHDILQFSFFVTWNILVQGFNFIQNFPVFSATMGTGTGRAFYKGAQVALIAIAINRFINVRYPLRAKILWSEKHTVAAIALQYAMVAGVVLAHASPESRIYFTNETRLVLSMPTRYWPVNPGRQFIISKALTLFNAVSSISVALLYTAIFSTLQKAKKGSPDEKQQGIVQRKLALQGLVLSSLMIVQGFLVVLKRAGIFFVPGLIALLTSTNYYIGPFIALLMSKELRQYAKSMVGHPTVQVGPKPNAPGSGKRSQKHKSHGSALDQA